MIKQLMAVALAAQIVLGIGPAKVQAEDNSYTSALTTDSASPIAESVVDERENNRVNTGPHVFATENISSGTWGTCPWSLSSDGVLTIGAGKGTDLIAGSAVAPWFGPRQFVKTVYLSGEVILPQSIQCMFEDCFNLTEITGPGWFNYWTGPVKFADRVFNQCRSLTHVDFGVSSETISCRYMYANCDSLTDVNMYTYAGGKIQDWSGMFVGDYALKSVRNAWRMNFLSATDASAMFEHCESLESLDTSSFNIDSSVDIHVMFCGCKKLTAIDISHFKANASTPMEYLFYDAGLYEIKMGPEFAIPDGSVNVFPTPALTKSGLGPSIGTWGLGTETAAKQYTADQLMAIGKTAGALNGTWYAQRNAIFTGWNTAPNGSGTTYKPGDALPNQNLDLYAQWG